MHTNTAFYVNSARFTLIRTNVSTYDRQICLIGMSIFPSALRNMHGQMTLCAKINLTTCKLMSVDISTDWMQISYWYIARYFSIGVDVCEYNCFKLHYDAVLNIYTSTQIYTYRYLLEYIKNFQIQCIQIQRFMPIQLNSISSEHMYHHMTGNSMW